MAYLAWSWSTPHAAGYVDIGVKLKILSLDLKGRFYAIVFFRPKGEILRHARRFVHNSDILRKVFWRISALVFKHYYHIIKGRLYADHMSGVKACLYDNVQTQGRGYEPRTRCLNLDSNGDHLNPLLLRK